MACCVCCRAVDLPGSLPENAPPPWAPRPPYVSTMIFRPVRPLVAVRSADNELPVGLSMIFDFSVKELLYLFAKLHFNPWNEDVDHILFDRFSIFFSSLSKSSCWVETTMVCTLFGVPLSLYSIVTWLFESGPEIFHLFAFAAVSASWYTSSWAISRERRKFSVSSTA